MFITGTFAVPFRRYNGSIFQPRQCDNIRIGFNIPNALIFSGGFLKFLALYFNLLLFLL